MIVDRTITDSSGNALAAVILVAPFVEMYSVSFGIPLDRPNLGYARKVDPPHGATEIGTRTQPLAVPAAVAKGTWASIWLGLK